MASEMNSIYSEKQRDLFVIEQYKFRFHKFLKNNIERWCCCKKTCKSYIHLNSDNNDVGSQKKENELLNCQIMTVDDICEKLSKIINSELLKRFFVGGFFILDPTIKHDIDTLTTYDLQLIRKNMHYAHSSVLPRLPKNLEELQTSLDNMSDFLLTNRNVNFLLVNDLDSNILLFLTKTNLMFLSNVKTIFVDGTFKSCPSLFTQILFTVHGLQNDEFIPLLFFLLPNKESKSYEKAFLHIMSECSKINILFSPKKVFADFEKAIHLAILSVWPSITLKGCRFHLGQSWYRKIQSIGLSSEYKIDSDTSKYLKYFFGLPFLLPDEVIDCFTDDLISIKPYIYIHILPESSFPLSLWAEYSATTIRTTNSCESFHSKLNAMFYNAHPNIFQFIDTLKRLQTDIYIKQRSTHLKNRTTSIINKEQFLKQAIADFQSKKISRFEFIKLTILQLY
ncbi:MULE domain-containing protein, partial [Aphis craccivora]